MKNKQPKEFDVTQFNDRMTAAQGAVIYAIKILKSMDWKERDIIELVIIELRKNAK